MKDIIELIKGLLKEPAIFLIALGHVVLASAVAMGLGLWLHFGDEGSPDPRFATLFTGSLMLQCAAHAAYVLVKKRRSSGAKPTQRAQRAPSSAQKKRQRPAKRRKR